MGEATKAGDHVPMPERKIGRSGVNQLSEQRQGRLLHRQLLAVHQRHQPELPPRLVGLGLHPAQLQRPQAEGQGLGIASESLGAVTPELAGELIEQQQQRQAALGGFAPGAQLTGDRLAGEAQEALPHQCIKIRILAEPLAGGGVVEPEIQDRFGIDQHGRGKVRLSPSSIHPGRCGALLKISVWLQFEFGHQYPAEWQSALRHGLQRPAGPGSRRWTRATAGPQADPAQLAARCT